MKNSIQELKEKRAELVAQANAMQDTADTEKRDLTEDESKQIESLFAAVDASSVDIARRERLEALGATLAAPSGRKVQPEDGATTMTAAPLQGSVSVSGGVTVASQSGTGGFKRLGDFVAAVHGAVVGRKVDPRLTNAAVSTVSSEGTGSDGGYLVPPDFRTLILQKVQGEDALLTMTDQQTTTSNSITFPVDETTPWQTSGGIQVSWEGEATPYNQSKTALKAVTVRATKIAAVVPVTDELLEDAPSLEAFLRKKTPEKITYKLNDAIMNGDGSGKPQGILNSPALVTVAKEAGQANGTILFKNIQKMWSSMYAPLRRNAVWVINQDVEPYLGSMTVPADTAGGTGIFPAYLPPGGLAGGPNGTLMGRPIVYTEAAQAVGTPGDISLVNFQEYLTVVKAGGLKSDISIHLWFDQGLTAFRFTMRVGGQGWWSAPITRAKSANPLSCFVALAQR